MSQFHALILDFDGLILDTERIAVECWQEIFAESGCQFPVGKWVRSVGGSEVRFDPPAELSQLLGCELDHKALRHRFFGRALPLIDELEMMDGVSELMEQATDRELHLSVASSSPHNWVDRHLQRLGIIDRFAAICCSDDVGARKPDPAVYLACLQALSLPCDRTLAFEDSANGIQAAKAAGICCVAVPNAVTRRTDLSLADLQLATLRELSLDEIFASVGAG